MARFLIARLGIVFIVIPLTVGNAQINGHLKIAVIRVSFKPDSSPGTTGDGSFLLTSGQTDCGKYTIDPPPHDRSFYLSQLEAVDSYFSAVSYGAFGIDLEGSDIFPNESDLSYTLINPMHYYHQLGDEINHEKRLTELFRDAVTLAVKKDKINLSEYDITIIIHAGVGQDFSLPFLDPTPEDIPSVYIDSDMLLKYLGGPIQIENMVLTQGIILPETQNQVFYEESLFSELSAPCDAQYGLTGTFALMVGFAVGLPPLWETESGRSGIGIFGLMDQGSNNGRGVIPSPPNAWSRIYSGWESPIEIKNNTFVEIHDAKNQIAKIPINQNEYFLIENRVNWLRDGVSIDSLRYAIWEISDTLPTFTNTLMDSVNISIDSNGVIVKIPNYNLGMPASGLLIWHIDEARIYSGIQNYSVNGDRAFRGIDLEEADGAQDMGYISQVTPDPSSGYFGDMWFEGNREYERANPEMKEQMPVFGPFSYPDTRSNDNASSFLSVENISPPGHIMTFSVRIQNRVNGIHSKLFPLRLLTDLNQDGIQEIIGGNDSLWIGNTKQMKNIKYFYNPIGTIQSLSVDRSEINKRFLVLNEIISETTLITHFEFNSTGNEFVWYSDTTLNVAPVVFVDKPNAFSSSYLYGEELNSFKHLVFTEDSFNHLDYFYGDALIDFNLDGKGEIISLDSSGMLHVFHENNISYPGSPVKTNAYKDTPVLVGQLFSEPYPELVLQDNETNLVIYNHLLNIESKLAVQGELVSLGVINGINCILTTKEILLFEEKTTAKGNQWTHKNGDEGNTRTLRLEYPVSDPPNQLLNDIETYAYPNPAYDEKVIIRIGLGIATGYKVDIYDISGLLIAQSGVINASYGDLNEWVWDIHDMDSGVYFVKVKAIQGIKSEEKILKVGVIK